MHDLELRRRVRLLMQRTNLRFPSDRRRDRRVPFPYPIHITPCVDGADGVCGERTWLVFGKHLAERGLDFYHRGSLAARQVIASFECQRDRWVSFALSLDWCRFNRHRWYETGGRFVGVAESPSRRQLEDALWGFEAESASELPSSSDWAEWSRPIAVGVTDDVNRTSREVLVPSFGACFATLGSQWRDPWATGNPQG